MAQALVKITRILETFPEAGRRTLAYEVWRTYGGALTSTERSRQSRQRWGGDTVALPLQGATVGSPPTPPSTTASVGFQVPVSVREALSKTKRLGASVRIRTADFWQAEVRANPGVNFAAEVLKAEAWMVANPDRAPRKNYARFLHGWLGRAEREEE